MSEFSHVDNSNKASMVDISSKQESKRTAIAQSIISANQEVLESFDGRDILSKKGPIFQTAILAGVMAAKKTPELIPLCHGLNLEDCQITIQVVEKNIIVVCTCTTTGKTGVEMEALTGASVASLTIYDMCKAVDKGIIISETKLLKKTGGKSDYSA